ncbi:hypothetical protein DVR12_06280 [Chitinophaga silvatica]|uniref:HmuY protein n=1 Tax=Chitinophaga silvatica TaxID=2282649 RepID=A0A3E1YE67_9BACT|nr:hypothetical protein [Chitinophaga silvatica]RFS24798.1 hypothetical protein DVR12_06280 [Chitinophaga silvatica]
MTKITRNFSKLTWMLAGAGFLFLASCSKDQNVTAPTLQPLSGTAHASITVPDGGSANITNNNGQGKVYRDGSVYRVENFRQTYVSDTGQPAAGTFFWRFSDNDAGTITSYNIKFSGVATGDISAASTDTLRYVDIAFASVTASNWATAQVPVANTIGMNSVTGTGVPPAVLALANGKGWYTYNWSLGHTVIPVSNRTLLFKTGSTLIAFEIISIYQNQVVGGPFPYYHFRYKAL